MGNTPDGHRTQPDQQKHAQDQLIPETRASLPSRRILAGSSSGETSSSGSGTTRLCAARTAAARSSGLSALNSIRGRAHQVAPSGSRGTYQPLAVFAHPHQHATPPVQVHPDDLPAVICFRHRGPPDLDPSRRAQLSYQQAETLFVEASGSATPLRTPRVRRLPIPSRTGRQTGARRDLYVSDKSTTIVNRAGRPRSPHHQRTRPYPHRGCSANQAVNTRWSRRLRRP
jgi:hypothetical protein